MSIYDDELAYDAENYIDDSGDYWPEDADYDPYFDEDGGEWELDDLDLDDHDYNYPEE
jgi:hypothetical protein